MRDCDRLNNSNRNPSNQYKVSLLSPDVGFLCEKAAVLRDIIKGTPSTNNFQYGT
jgi:hypothetical protein